MWAWRAWFTILLMRCQDLYIDYPEQYFKRMGFLIREWEGWNCASRFIQEFRLLCSDISAAQSFPRLMEWKSSRAYIWVVMMCPEVCLVWLLIHSIQLEGRFVVDKRNHFMVERCFLGFWSSDCSCIKLLFSFHQLLCHCQMAEADLFVA